MATKTKTVGKTTNTIKKGAATMTATEAIKQLMITYNNYQEYRKNNNETYNFASKQQIIDFARQLTTEELIQLTKTYAYLRKIQQRLSNYLYQEKKLNNAYGKEDKNIMELTDEERELINKRRAKYQELDSQKKADTNTHKAISRALSQEEYKDIRYSTRVKYKVERIIANKDKDEIVFIEGLSHTDEELLEEYKDCILRYYKSYHVTRGDTKETHHMFTFATIK